MGYMDFKSPILEKIFKQVKWTRNNTIEIYNQAEASRILEYTSSSSNQKKYTFQPIIFQFQCIVTTTDTYYRKLTDNPVSQFGVFVEGSNIIQKKQLSSEKIKRILKEQLPQLQDLFKPFTNQKVEEYVNDILAFSNHEYLHQGQFILMFREAGVELPERFKKAWAL